MFTDIHCHLLPGIDDGAADLAASLQMAEMAVGDGISTIVVTPHQLGNFAGNRGDDIRRRVTELQQQLDLRQIPLRILPGADVRIEDQMLDQLAAGDVLTLADRGRHVLLELPHEVYFPLEGLLERMHRRRLTGILSHPERNGGLLKRPELIPPLVDQGCLMQITASSLMGVFGRECQRMCEWMLGQQVVHFVATDAHSPRSRRPLLRRAFERVGELAGEKTARLLCCDYPALVAEGQHVPAGRVAAGGRTWRSLFPRRKAA
ncbi:MAG: hypothetical protein KDA61_18145 [Planctomycetales bacterium]|nr:hypothetical protein [Planctomycetales bacterium]